MSTLLWTPYPGHWPGQRDSDRFYGSAEYRECLVEIHEATPGRFSWSFYDEHSPDPELAVARSDDPFGTFDEAEADVMDYIDGTYPRDTGAAGMGTILATFTALVLGLVLGLTSSMWNPYAIAGDTAVREHQQRVIDHGVCYEDGSCDDGYCAPGAYCDDTVAVTREDDHR